MNATNSVTQIPTGYMFLYEGSKGMLEALSIKDYGKSRNVKAEFLGLTNEINGVANGNPMPLQEKWVITISTQYGCPQKCVFCDVPAVKFLGNATFNDLKGQVMKAISLNPEVIYTERLNIHFARMGEPAHNYKNIFELVRWLNNYKEIFQWQSGLRVETIHPVFTTSLPKISNLSTILYEWCDIKNKEYRGQAGLQISINSTNEDQRQEMFAGGSITLEEFANIAHHFPAPIGRKYCLNFALADNYETDGAKIANLFNPDSWMIKITPIHHSKSCITRGIQTTDGYSSFVPYKNAEQSFKDVGFDVLVFVPSQEEETSLVTCGNLVLSQNS